MARAENMTRDPRTGNMMEKLVEGILGNVFFQQFEGPGRGSYRSDASTDMVEKYQTFHCARLTALRECQHEHDQARARPCIILRYEYEVLEWCLPGSD